MELLSLFLLIEASNGPAESVDEVFLIEFSWAIFMAAQQSSVELNEVVDASDFRQVHDGSPALKHNQEQVRVTYVLLHQSLHNCLLIRVRLHSGCLAFQNPRLN